MGLEGTNVVPSVQEDGEGDRWSEDERWKASVLRKHAESRRDWVLVKESFGVALITHRSKDRLQRHCLVRLSSLSEGPLTFSIQKLLADMYEAKNPAHMMAIPKREYRFFFLHGVQQA